jgi:hypothetical protein
MSCHAAVAALIAIADQLLSKSNCRRWVKRCSALRGDGVMDKNEIDNAAHEIQQMIAVLHRSIESLLRMSSQQV